jgi:hypothetical protein
MRFWYGYWRDTVPTKVPAARRVCFSKTRWFLKVLPAPDRFETGPWLLEFERAKETITGFVVHRQRLWKLGFEKAEGTAK